MIRRGKNGKGSLVVGFSDGEGNLIESSLKTKSNKDNATHLVDGFEMAYGTLNVVVPEFNPVNLAKLIEENTYHAKAIQAKAEDASGIGYEILMTDEDKEEEKRILEGVLEETNIVDEFYNTVIDIEGMGYGTFEVAREARLSSKGIDNIYHVNSKDVRVHRSRDKFVQEMGGKYVWFKRVGYAKDVHIQTGEEFKEGDLPLNQRANEMYFTSKYVPSSPVYGMSDGVPALGALMGDISRRDYNLNFFKSGGMAKWAIVISGDIKQLEEVKEYNDKGELESYIPNIQDQAYEMLADMKDNQHGAMILTLPTTDGGKIDVNFEKLSDEQKEISFRDFRKDNRDEILSVHGVPRQRLGISEEGSLGGQNSEELNGIYMESVIEPITSRLEDFVNNIWIPSLGLEGVKFRIKRRYDKGVESDIDILERLYKMEAVKSKEVRDLFKDKFNLTDEEIEDKLNNEV